MKTAKIIITLELELVSLLVLIMLELVLLSLELLLFALFVVDSWFCKFLGKGTGGSERVGLILGVVLIPFTCRSYGSNSLKIKVLV